MDRGLTDLDALLLTVRNQQTKNYLAEAVVSYRIGAYRLAIVGTWTAVAFDIIAKIRELASSDADPQAMAFIDEFDRNVAANNISKLLQIERGLIDTASTKFGFPSTSDVAFLKRLQDDRHLCAHPAFAQSNELFRPVPDLVRAHIVQSVEGLLALPAMSGKAIIDVFITDINSNAFPRDRERAVDYVRRRYLSRMRASAKRNLAVVLIKGVVNTNVPELLTREESVLDSLEAIERDEPQTFSAEILPLISEVLDRGDETSLINGLYLLKRVPAIIAKLQTTTLDRINALAKSEASDIGIFGAFGLISAEIDDALLKRFPELEPGQMSGILLSRQDARFVPAVLQSVRDAGSFRSAEARLANAMHVAPAMTAGDFASLVAAVAENAQVTNANASPQILLQLITYAIDHGLHGDIDWLTLRRAVWWMKPYSDLWGMLAERSIYVASPGQPPDDE